MRDKGVKWTGTGQKADKGVGGGVKSQRKERPILPPSCWLTKFLCNWCKHVITCHIPQAIWIMNIFNKLGIMSLVFTTHRSTKCKSLVCEKPRHNLSHRFENRQAHQLGVLVSRWELDWLRLFNRFFRSYCYCFVSIFVRNYTIQEDWENDCYRVR